MNGALPIIGFPAADQREALRRSLVQRHMGDTHISAEAYFRDRRITLGAEARKRMRVYLDTKFWIYLRDALAGAPSEPAHSELLSLLVDLVESGRAVCPLADCAFIELLKQRDRDKRLAAARTMDLLSQGVSLRKHDDRVRAEILHFIRRLTSAPNQIYPLEEMVWTRAGFVMGDLRPMHNGLSPDTTEALAKAFDDLVWMSTLEEMLSEIEQELEIGSEFYSRLATKLNEGKFRHASELTSYRSAYETELRGAINAHAEDISGALPAIYQNAGGREAPSDEQMAESGRMLGNAIYYALTKKGKLRDLPTFNVQAGIHAAIRWDTKRKYNPNDWLDILHAAAGVPYCDIFLTERSLAALVTSSHLAYDKRYDTQVLCTPAEAIRAIEERAAQQANGAAAPPG